MVNFGDVRFVINIARFEAGKFEVLFGLDTFKHDNKSKIGKVEITCKAPLYMYKFVHECIGLSTYFCSYIHSLYGSIPIFNGISKVNLY